MTFAFVQGFTSDAQCLRSDSEKGHLWSL